MFSSNRWILCDGGTATQPPWPSPLPSGVLSYAYTPPGGSVQGKIIIGVPNSTITLTIPDLRGRFVMGYVGTSNFAYSNTITSAQTTNQQLLAAQSNQTGATISGVANYPGGINNFGGVMTQSLILTDLPAHSHTIPSHNHTAQTATNVTVTTYAIGAQQNQYVSGIAPTQGDKAQGGQEAIVQSVAWSEVDVTFGNTANALSTTLLSQDAAKNTGQEGNATPRSNLPPYWVLAYIMRIG
jgi:microcystin-dependent protein